METTRSPSKTSFSKQSRKSFRQYVQERSECEIKVSNFSVVDSATLLKQLDLDADFEKFVQHQKKVMGDSIYFFEVWVKSKDNTERTLTLYKRYIDFEHLSKQINKDLKKAKILTPCPQPLHISRGKTPTSTEDIEIIKHLEHFFNELLNTEVIRKNSHSLYDFLEISSLSFIGGPKIYKEGYLAKRTGGRFTEGRLQTYFGIICKRWLKRWFVVCEEGILYTNELGSTYIREMLFFDQSFNIKYGRKSTGSKSGIILTTSTRKLHLRATNLYEALEWIYSIKEASRKCHYINTNNRFYSFAPVREPNASCKWYIDGEDYYSDICDYMMKAKREIFITGWWVSPELHLKRPVTNDEYRLDNVLKSAAERGVKICIFIYKEVKQVLYNDSAYTKSYLESLHKNIKVLRHPKDFLFLWSHHEKLVIVDQTYGFLGGLDLCYGRMDTNAHPLNDPTYETDGTETFPGIEYANPRVRDFVNVKQHEKSQIKKNIDPKLPWHDVATRVIGDAVKDLTRHFIQCWNFAQIDIKGKDDYFITIQQKEEKEKELSRSSIVGKIRRTVLNLIRSPRKHRTSTTSLERLEDENFEQAAANTARAWNSVPMPVHEKIEKKDTDPEIRSPMMDNLEIPEVNSQVYGQEEDAVMEMEEKKDPIKLDDIAIKQSTDFRMTKSISLTKPLGDELPAANMLIDEQHKLRVKRTSLSVAKYESRLSKKTESMLVSRPLKEFAKTGSLILITNNEKDDNVKYTDLLKRAQEQERSPTTMHYKNVTRKPKRLMTTKEKEKEKEKEKQLDKAAEHSPLIQRFRTMIGSEKKDDSSKKVEKKEKINDTFFEKNMLQPLWLKQESSKQGQCSCQILRSASSWSIGLDYSKPEFSIQAAYIKLIEKAKEFIYIENQFFISSTAGGTVGNRIAEALVLRIVEAHQSGKPFRVVVFLPLMPAFEGEIDDSSAKVLRIQLYWQYRTISRASRSIFKLLEAKNITQPEKYIQFFSLRQHTKLNGKPVTEMIYIHTKLMIIDDSIAILGSANINDRSMQGSRDSELGIIIEDLDQVESIMNGERVAVGRYAHTLRTSLWKEHLGLSEEEVMDPLDPDLIRKMDRMAKRNTEVYREVFACYPDDNITRLAQVKEWRNKKNLDRYDELQREIEGSIVQFPCNFLSQEDLRLGLKDLEYYVPEINFT